VDLTPEPLDLLESSPVGVELASAWLRHPCSSRLCYQINKAEGAGLRVVSPRRLSRSCGLPSHRIHPAQQERRIRAGTCRAAAALPILVSCAETGVTQLRKIPGRFAAAGDLGELRGNGATQLRKIEVRR
jgi:hypothetical protein